MEEGIAALLSCRVLNERTTVNMALWRPDDDADNSVANMEAAGSASCMAFTPPGYRRLRQRQSTTEHTAGRSSKERSWTRFR